jgi:hypothetical protein
MCYNKINNGLLIWVWFWEFSIIDEELNTMQQGFLTFERFWRAIIGWVHKSQ